MVSFIINNILHITIGLLFTSIGILYKKVKHYLKKQKTLENVLINLLRIEILELYEKIQNRTCINIYEVDKIEQLYNEYKFLDSNRSLNYVIKYINNIKVEESCLYTKNIDKLE